MAVKIITCPWCGKEARITYEENRVYQMKCYSCHNTMLHVDHSFDSAVEFFEHQANLLQAEQDGRLFELPFVAMVEQSLQNGKMKPMGDQKHNGRYAVVYVDRNKWKSPLIDICGKPYQREEAEIRMAELDGKGGEG